MKISASLHTCAIGEFTVFRIENASGASVELSTLGAAILSVNVPDRNGKIDNVALRYADPADYLNDDACLGKSPGRFANRIAGGHLVVSGKEYKLRLNAGPNAIHGGPTGFQNRIWDAEPLDNGVRMTYHADDMEENFPGALNVSATFLWSDDNRLSLEFTAVSDAETVVNLTNHVYWNLNGADSGKILNHNLKVKAHNWLPIDSTHIPTGEIAVVEDTPMDFRNAKMIGRDINADFPPLNIGGGYGQCWVFDNWKRGKLQDNLVVLSDDSSGRMLAISSDQPGAQIYTANRVENTPLNCSGRPYGPQEGVAIEMQHFPDSPNHPNFPSTLLKPGEIYRSRIIWEFSVQP